jgi:hypothetical protein
MAIPVIYKGDDTDFRGSTGFMLKVITSSNLNLSGCTVEVEVLGFRKSFPASATGELVCPFAFSAAETQRMPLGIHAATVRVYDAKGRVRTINNSIRVKVTNVISEAYGETDPNEVVLKISTLDLSGYAKKNDLLAYATKTELALKADKLRFHKAKVSGVSGMNAVVVEPQTGAANHANVSLASDASIVLSYDGPTSAKQSGSSAVEFELPAAGEASGSFVFNDLVA